MKRSGFSLVECMVYCMVLAILFMTWFHGMVVSHTRVATESARTNQLSNMYAAHDILIRDISQSPTEITLWKVLNNATLIWHTNKCDIGWSVQDNKLVRIEGNYNATKQIWHKKKQSVALYDVERITFTNRSSQSYITDIEYDLILRNNKTVHVRITLCNGVINA